MSPIVQLRQGEQAAQRTRMLINGGPNKRKTTALLTFPRPIAIFSYPGEKGWNTIPRDDPEILPFIWTEDKAQDSHAVVRDVERVLAEIRAGKYGKIHTLAGDGLHKYVDYVMDSTTDGAYFAAQEFEPKLYARGYRAVFEHLGSMMDTLVPVVVFTCWSEDEKDRKQRVGEKSSDVPSHVMPALPGQLATKIMGEFSVIVHQDLRKLDPKDPNAKPEAVWQTRPAGEVWGCSLKGPKAIVEQIPTYIKADYRELIRYWDAAEQALGSPTPRGGTP